MGSIFCCYHNQNVEPELEIPRFYGEKLHINDYTGTLGIQTVRIGNYDFDNVTSTSTYNDEIFSTKELFIVL